MTFSQLQALLAIGPTPHNLIAKACFRRLMTVKCLFLYTTPENGLFSESLLMAMFNCTLLIITK
jgi:hypothetical protein